MCTTVLYDRNGWGRQIIFNPRFSVHIFLFNFLLHGYGVCAEKQQRNLRFTALVLVIVLRGLKAGIFSFRLTYTHTHTRNTAK